MNSCFCVGSHLEVEIRAVDWQRCVVGSIQLGTRFHPKPLSLFVDGSYMLLSMLKASSLSNKSSFFLTTVTVVGLDLSVL